MAALLALLAGCAQAPLEEQRLDRESVVPGTIGIMVRQQERRVVVSAVGRHNSAVRVGDVILRYNGETVTSARHFYRLVIDSAPGSRARLELERDGTPRVVELPVRELDVMPRV